MNDKKNKVYAILIALVVLVVSVGVFFIINTKLDKKKNHGDSPTGEKEGPILMKISDEYEGEFWKYKESIKTITFEEEIDIPDVALESWDVSENKDSTVMAYIKTNTNNPTYYDLYIQGNGKIYANPNSSHLFSGFTNVDSINNIETLDTSKVTNMNSMFAWTGYSSPVFILDLGSNFDTSNVTDMSFMFYETGYSSTVFTLDLGDKFNTSNVTDMSWMFLMIGYNSPVFTLDLGDKFDTSNVTDMDSMFIDTGYSSSLFNLDCRNWNVNKVTSYRNFNDRVGNKVIEPRWNN